MVIETFLLPLKGWLRMFANLRALPKIIGSAARSRLGLPARLVQRDLLGTILYVSEPTTLPGLDYDHGWLYALISECSVFFDIGCNVGFVSLLACTEDASRKILAVDANPAALAVAAANIIRNGFGLSCRFASAFIGDSDGSEVEFFSIGTNAGASRFASLSPARLRRAAGTKARTARIDTLSRELMLVPDLVKIDVEGAELEALRGASQIARQFRPSFIVELHSSRERPMRENAALVLSWCEDLGYDAYYLKLHARVDTPDAIAHRGRCHLLLLPLGQAYPRYLRQIAQGASLEQAAAVMNSYRGRR